MRVVVHTKDCSESEWKSQDVEFRQVPAIGEYFVFSSGASWYQVQMVVHYPMQAECDAEVFGTKSNETTASTLAGRESP